MNDKELQTLVYHLSLIILNSISFILNLLILVIFIHYRKQFFPTQSLLRRLRATRNHNKCLFSMVAADILVGFFGILTGVLLKYVQSSLIYKLCGLIPLYGSMFVSTFSLILLTMDRLFAIKYPFSYDKLMSNLRITVFIALCWIVPILTTISQMIIYVTEGLELELKIRNTILTIVSLTGFVVLLISNAVLIQKVKQQSKRSATLVNKPHSPDATNQEEICNEPVKMNNNGTLNSGKPDIDSEITSDSSPSVSLEIESHKMSFSSDADKRTTENLYPRRKTIAFLTRCDSINSIGATQFRRSNTVSFPIDEHDLIRDENSAATILQSLQETKTESTEILISRENRPEKMPNDVSDGTQTGTNMNSEYCHGTRLSAICQSRPNGRRASVKPKVDKRIRDKKITIMCICIVVAFLICWLPLVGYRFSYVVGRTTIVPWFRRLTQCLAVTNSLFNPFIYFLVREDFRELLKRMLKIGVKKV